MDMREIMEGCGWMVGGILIRRHVICIVIYMLCIVGGIICCMLRVLIICGMHSCCGEGEEG